MTIDGINKVNNSYNVARPSKTGKISQVRQNDSVEISSKALKNSETARYIEIVKNSPDIRSEKVEQAKINLSAYMQDSKIKPEVLDKMIDRIMDVVLG